MAKKIIYSEPKSYFPKSIRKSAELGEFAKVGKDNRNKQENKKNSEPKKKKANSNNKKSTKMTRAEYDDMRQIDWGLVDPYVDD